MIYNPTKKISFRLFTDHVEIGMAKQDKVWGVSRLGRVTEEDRKEPPPVLFFVGFYIDEGDLFVWGRKRK